MLWRTGGWNRLDAPSTGEEARYILLQYDRKNAFHSRLNEAESRECETRYDNSIPEVPEVATQTSQCNSYSQGRLPNELE